MSVPNCGSFTPKLLLWVNSSHEFHSLETPAPAISASRPEATARTSPTRPPTISWYRSMNSSSGPAGRNGGASRSAITRLTHIRRKKAPVKMTASAILAPRTPRHTSDRPRESNQR